MALPSSGPLSLAQINAELGWGYNLAIYIGKTFYRGNTAVVISNSPSFAEFYGLAPSPSGGAFAIDGFTPPSPQTVFGSPGVNGASQTINLSGGTPPYNYAWSIVTGPGSFSTGVNGANVGINANLASGSSYTILLCQVGDSVGNSLQANYQIEWEIA